MELQGSEGEGVARWALDWIDALGFLFVLLWVAVALRADRLDIWAIIPLFSGAALAVPMARRRWSRSPADVSGAASAGELGGVFLIVLGLVVGLGAAGLLIARTGELYRDLGDATLVVVGAVSVVPVFIGHLIDRRRLAT
jgi:hypothetical protein